MTDEEQYSVLSWSVPVWSRWRILMDPAILYYTIVMDPAGKSDQLLTLTSALGTEQPGNDKMICGFRNWDLWLSELWSAAPRWEVGGGSSPCHCLDFCSQNHKLIWAPPSSWNCSDLYHARKPQSYVSSKLRLSDWLTEVKLEWLKIYLQSCIFSIKSGTFWAPIHQNSHHYCHHHIDIDFFIFLHVYRHLHHCYDSSISSSS